MASSTPDWQLPSRLQSISPLVSRYHTTVYCMVTVEFVLLGLKSMQIILCWWEYRVMGHDYVGHGSTVEWVGWVRWVTWVTWVVGHCKWSTVKLRLQRALNQQSILRPISVKPPGCTVLAIWQYLPSRHCTYLPRDESSVCATTILSVRNTLVSRRNVWSYHPLCFINW